jgi:Uma2 family endonuclease
MSMLPRAEAAELRSGDRMTQEEFHRLYELTPPDFHAELVGGIVYVTSPLKRQHGTRHVTLGTLFWIYAARTPGVEAGDNATVILGEHSEPQPDLYLRILPEFGGRSRTTADDYVSGPPELIAELAHSSRAIDLHAKRDDYGRYGVREYLVLCLAEGELRWFNLGADEAIAPPEDGIYRLQQFPGLWIHAEALLGNNRARLLATLEQGLASPEHAEFVRRLEAAQSGRTKGKKTRRPRGT